MKYFETYIMIRKSYNKYLEKINEQFKSLQLYSFLNNN